MARLYCILIAPFHTHRYMANCFDRVMRTILRIIHYVYENRVKNGYPVSTGRMGANGWDIHAVPITRCYVLPVIRFIFIITLKFANFVPREMLAHASHIPFDTQVEYSTYEYLQCRIPVLSHLREEGVFRARIVIANSPSPIVIIGYKWASRQEWFLVPRLTVRHLRIFLAEVMIISIRRLSTIHHMLIYMLIRTAHLSITALIYNYIRLWNALFTTCRSKCIFTRFEMLFECAKHFECNTCLLDAIASRVAKYFFILNKHIFTYLKYIDMLFSIFL